MYVFWSLLSSISSILSPSPTLQPCFNTNRVGVGRNRKTNLLIISETCWIAYSGIILLSFNWSFLVEISHWINFEGFCVSAGFISECLVLSEINVQKKESQYRHYQNFSPTLIPWIQKLECLSQETEFKFFISDFCPCFMK